MNKLLKIKGSLPFLAAVFLNSFIDLGHKIIIQNTIFKVYDGQQQVILTAIINGLILLPVLLLFGVVGTTADKYAKNQVMRVTAWVGVLLTLAITTCYALGWFWVAFAMTFLLAAQSAFYYPAKYGYIKGFFGKEHLAEANGLVQAVSIIAILSGILVFSILFEYWFPGSGATKAEIIRGLVPVGLLLAGNALLEVVMVYRLPQVDSGNTREAIGLRSSLSGQLVKQTLAPVLGERAIWRCILGLAMFWSIGQVMLAAFPAFAKEQLGETNTVVIQAVIAASGLGIALGSSLASRFSRNYIETGLIPWGAAGIALGLSLLPGLDSALLMGLDFLFIGVMGGVFIVPLNALVQFYASDRELGKVLAASNLMQNIAMTSFLLLTVGFALAGISSKQLLVLIAAFAVIGGIYTVLKLPQSLVRSVFTVLLSARYRLTVEGMENIPEKGGLLLIGNSSGWLDWALVQIACPRPVTFVLPQQGYDVGGLNWLFRLLGGIPMVPEQAAKEVRKQVIGALNAGKVVYVSQVTATSLGGEQGAKAIAAAADRNINVLPLSLSGLEKPSPLPDSGRLKASLARRHWLTVVIGQCLH